MFLNIDALRDYLLSRPIANVFENLSDSEKHSETALKFMCLVDLEMETHGLYARISATNYPKLRNELLGFHSYKSFIYYSYKNILKFKGMNLQCYRCQFFGPLAITLNHMAMNHNIAVNYRICAYCGQEELKKHFSEDGSLQRCYEQYLQKIDVSDIILESTGVHKIIIEFYRVLKKLSEALKVLTYRQLHYYTGKGCGKPDIVTVEHGNDLRSSCTVYKQRIVKKKMSKEKLNEMFEVAMIARYGRDQYLNQFIKMEPQSEEDVEMITNISDDEEENATDDFDQHERQPSISDDTEHSRMFRSYSLPTSSSISPTFSTICGQSTVEEEMGQYVTSRLRRLSQDDDRRELEFIIQESIITFEKKKIFAKRYSE